MRVFLLFLICLAIVGGVAGNLPNCPRSSSLFARTNLFARLGYGYDPKRVTSFKTGFTTQVLKLTDRGHTLKFPAPSTLEVPVPCEAGENHHFIRGGQRYSLDKVITSYDQYKRLISVGGRIGVETAGQVVSGSVGGSYTRNSLLNQKSVTVLKYRSFRQVEIWLATAIDSPTEKAPVLDWWTPDFANAVKVLDASNSSDSSYSTLINKFGTHVVSRVVVGTFIEINANMAYCEYRNLEKIEGAIEVRRKLLDGLSAEAKAHAKSSSSSGQTKLDHFSNTNRGGGDETAYQKNGDVDQYITDAEQVKKPAIIPRETQFIEIWKLLPVSDSRRDLLKEAVQAYVGPQLTPVTSVQCTGTGARMAWLSPFAAVLTAIFLCVLY